MLDKVNPRLLAKLPNLEELDLGYTELADATCERLSQLPALARLRLSRTRVSDAGVASLVGCSKLTELTLTGRLITDRCVQDLGKKKSLKWLDVRDTDITPAGAKALADSFGRRCSIQSGKRNPRER